MDALTIDGDLHSWGNRLWATPNRMCSKEDINGNFVKLSAGNKFSLGLTDKGHIYGWGVSPATGWLFFQQDSGCLGEKVSKSVKSVPRPEILFDPKTIFNGHRVVDIEARDGKCMAITDGNREADPLDEKQKEQLGLI